MDNNRPLFILSGICPYQNRGCEAIIRGTVKVLRNNFKDPLFLSIGDPQGTDLIQQQRAEKDPAITHKKMNTIYYYGRKSFFEKIIYRLNKGKEKYLLWDEMFPYLNDSVAVLSVGGDNYSLDYGIPRFFTDLDDIVLEKKKPLILWGASVGPFDKLPEYERYMIDHLRKITGIFARESETEDYLKKNGITENVYRVADPAFLMDPVEPSDNSKGFNIDEDAIGINLSPLMAKYVTGGDLQNWQEIAADIVSHITEKTSRPVYLIPHVTIPDSNDFIFLKNVHNRVKSQIQSKIFLVPSYYNAAETKWIISQMSLFIGSRTHATIAALSSNIPTLSLAYSIKAKGINRDIFGHDEYCLNPNQMSPKIITSYVESMLASDEQIEMQLKEKIPYVQKKAMNAGKYLKDLLNNL